MTRFSTLAVFILIFGFFYGDSARCEKTAAADSMEYLGHAFVKIKTSEEKVIYIDPFGVNAFTDPADIVLTTHEHSDHNDLSCIRQKTDCQVIRSAQAIQAGVYQAFTIGSITITAVPAYNSLHQKNSCVGYVVEFNGIKIFHAGDTGNIAEFADLTSRHIDYALLPMDGTYTMTPEEATAAAAVIQAAFDVPIHTVIPPARYSDATVARFTSPHKLVIQPDETIALTVTTVMENCLSEEGYALFPNYPNPFNSSTTIRFILPLKEHIQLKVFDLLGREITTLFSGYLNAGDHSCRWDAVHMAGGAYVYSLETQNFRDTGKLLLVR